MKQKNMVFLLEGHDLVKDKEEEFSDWCAFSGKSPLPEDELEIGEVWYCGGKSISGRYDYIGGGFKS